MNIESLKYFIELVLYQNFTRAAEHLHISQPTISRHIANLENEFGVELYEHGQKKFALTKEGEVFYEGALEIVHKYDLLFTRMESLSSTSEQLTGTLSIGYTGTFFLNMLSTPISLFSNQYPDVDIMLNMAPAVELNHMVKEKGLDIIYTISTENPCISSDIVYQPYIDGHLQLLVPSNHRLALFDKIPTDELKDEHFILFLPPGAPILEDMMARLFYRNNISTSKITQVSCMQNMLLQVSAGKGIGLCLTFSQLECIESVEIKDFSDCFLNYNIFLAYREDNTNPLLMLYIREANKAKRLIVDSQYL